MSPVTLPAYGGVHPPECLLKRDRYGKNRDPSTQPAESERVAERLLIADEFEAVAFSPDPLTPEMGDAVGTFTQIIHRYNAAILAEDIPAARILSDQAHELAIALNDGDQDILASHNSTGVFLERKTAAPYGSVPLWGQTGSFILQVRPALRVRIEMEGIFGLAEPPIPSFTAVAIDFEQPFISEFSHHSFLGHRHPTTPRCDPAEHARRVILDYIGQRLNGQLRSMVPPHDLKFVRSPNCGFT